MDPHPIIQLNIAITSTLSRMSILPIEPDDLSHYISIPMTFYSGLAAYINTLTQGTESISEDRKLLLSRLTSYVHERLDTAEPIQLTFICTHNSRRSHMSQIWATVAAAYFGLDAVACYSGGTEVTAFNPRAVDALTRTGLRIDNPGGDNPRYMVHFADDGNAIECFSKVYDDPFNPQSDFAAIMTCSDADANCPFIPGAHRIAITYEDPKVADDTPEETIRYDERVLQIGTEMFYAFSKVHSS